MIGLRDFIIKIDKEFNDKFKTESGFEIWATEAFSADRLSNRHATVVNIPLLIVLLMQMQMQILLHWMRLLLFGSYVLQVPAVFL